MVATKSGNNPSTDTVTITIAEGEFSSLIWASFPAAARFGTDQTLNTPPVATPAADNYAIVQQSGPCTWDNTSKALAFTGTGDCVLAVTASKLNYISKTENFTVAVSPGSFASIAWSAFPASATVGETTAALAAPTSTPSFESHSIAKKSGDCTWNNTNKTIAFTGATPCVLTVTVVKANYENGVKDFTVTPGLALIAVDGWGSYNNGAVGGAEVPAATLSGLNPQDASKNYLPLNQTICTVNTSTGVVTPVLPGTCRVRLTLSKAGYNDKSHEYSLTITPGTQSAVAGFAYSSLAPKLSDTAPTLTTPTAPLDADFSYATTAAATICTVSSAGVVILKGTGNCPVTVTATRTNYNSVSGTVTIVIGTGEFSSLVWSSFPSSAKVGTPVTLTSPVSVPAADDYTIAHQSGSCAWDNSGKVLSFSGTGACVLTVSAAKTGFTAKEETFTVTVGQGTFTSISWADFPSSATIGTPTAALAAPTSVPAFEGHSIAKKSGDCSWDNTTKVISFTGSTACVLTVTATKTDYENGVKDFSVTPGLAAITVNDWGTYSNGAVGGGTLTAPTLTDVAPSSGVAKAYTSSTTGVCTVVIGTGVVTPKTSGTCTIRLSLSKENHNDLTHDYNITIAKGTFSALAWSDFPQSATVGVDTSALGDPASTPAAESYAVTHQAGACSWDNTTKIISFTGTSNCVLRVRAVKTEYTDKEKDFTVTPQAGTFTSIEWSAFPSTGMKVGVDSGNLGSPQIMPAPDMTTITKQSGGCAWNNVSKILSFTDTTACVIRVTARKSGYNVKHRDFSVTPAPATFTSIDWTAFPSSVAVGETTSAIANPVSVPAAATYDIAHQSGDCSWDSVARTLSFTAATACVIRVTARKTGFTPRMRDFSVTPGSGEITVGNWGSYGTVSVGGGAVAAPTLTDVNPTAVTKAWASTDTKVCSINNSGVVTGVNGGDCTIRLTLSATNYNDKTHDYNFTVVVNLKDFQRANLFNGLMATGSYSRPVFIDISGDNKEDLVLGGPDGRFRYFKKETLGYTEQTGVANPFDGFDVGTHSSPVFVDFDGDGNLDLISTGVEIESGYNEVYDFYYQTYTWKVFYYKKGNSGYTLQANPADLSTINDPFAKNVGGSSSSLSVNHLGFFNADDDADLELVAFHANTVVKYYDIVTDSQDTDYGHYKAADLNTDYPLKNIGIIHAAPIFVNLDGDSELELVVGGNHNDKTRGILKYFDKNNSGTYVEQTGENNPFGSLTVPLRPLPSFTDKDGDGNLDLILGSKEGTLKYYEKTDTGYVLDTRTANPFGHIDVGADAAPAMVNIDSDDDLELFIGHRAGVSYFEKNAQGVYEKQTGAANTFSTYFSDFTKNALLAFDDVNGDERMDFVVDDRDSSLSYYQQKTDGTFGKITGESSPLSAIDEGSNAMASFFADVDGDGKKDFIGGVHHSNLVTPVYGKKDSSGQFVLQTGNNNPFRNITKWSDPSPTLANLDTDSDLELLIAGSSHGDYQDQVKLYDKGIDNDNNAVYKPVAQDSDPFRWLSMRDVKPHLVDVDGDGDSDLLLGKSDGTIIFGLNINGEWLFFK